MRILVLLLFGAPLFLPPSALAADATLLSRLPGVTSSVVEAVGDHIYVGGGANGLHVLDGSGSAPVYAGSIPIAPGVVWPLVRDLDCRAGILYVAVRDYGIEAYDLSNPTAPSRIATVTDANSIEQIQVVGDRLYALDRYKDIFIYDVSGGPPMLLGSQDLLSDHEAYDFWVDGTDVYISRFRVYWVSDDVATADYSMLKFDASNPANPIPVGDPISGWDYYRYPFVYAGVLYVLTAASETSLIGLPAGSPQGIWGEEGRTYFPDDAGLIVDTPTGLSLLQGTTTAASLPLPGSGIRSDREGELLYRAAGRLGIQVVDVSDPLQMSVDSVWHNGGNSVDLVTTVPGVDYVTGTGGLRAVDVSSPFNPVVAWSFDEYSRGIAIDDDLQYLYVHFPNSGYLRVFDLTNPLSPQLIREVFPINFDADLVYRDSLLYVARDNGFEVYDVSDPAASMPQIGSLLLNCDPALALQGNYAYVGGTSNGNVVDISDPANPSLVGTFPYSTFVQATDHTILGDQLFVVGMTLDGVDVFSVADPAHPVAAGVALPGATERGYAVRSLGNLLALSQQNGIFVYDMTNPLSPTLELTVLDETFYETGVAFRGNQLHSAGEDFRIFATTLDPLVAAPTVVSRLQLLGITPNPFNPRTKISFTASLGARVEVEVLDLRGRRVAVPFTGMGTGNPQEVTWAPGDLASGVYLVRVVSGTQADTRKLTLIK